MHIPTRCEFHLTCTIHTCDTDVRNQSFMFIPTYSHPHIQMACALTSITDDRCLQLRGVNTSMCIYRYEKY
jgi:hypothetical protein